MKCVICEKEAEYVKDGMSLCEKHFKAQKVGDKEIDLVKIQIYTDSCHAKVTTLLGFMIAYFVGLSAIFYGVLYQAINATSTVSFWISVNTWSYGMIVTVIGTFIIGFVTLFIYRGDIKAISRMIEDVKAGKELPPLDRIGRKVKPEKQ
jgi:hypothetical protein